MSLTIHTTMLSTQIITIESTSTSYSTPQTKLPKMTIPTKKVQMVMDNLKI